MLSCSLPGPLSFPFFLFFATRSCAQGQLLVLLLGVTPSSRDHMRCPAPNPGHSRAGQAPCLMYCHSGPHNFNFGLGDHIWLCPGLTPLSLLVCLFLCLFCLAGSAAGGARGDSGDHTEPESPACKALPLRTITLTLSGFCFNLDLGAHWAMLRAPSPSLSLKKA